MDVTNYSRHSYFGSQLYRRNVARFRQGMAQSNDTFKLVVIVVRGPYAGGVGKADRRVENGIVGLGPLIDRSGVNIRLERRADLTQSLGRAIELRFIEVASPDKCFHVAR